jgi:dihydrofolate synthase/folylpolyglutamate synthase
LTTPGIVPGLDNVTRLLQEMGNPQQSLKCVHVGGTNGKGSTSLIIEEIMTAAGYRVGRFSSPHLHVYTERITINGQQISTAEFNQQLAMTARHIESMVSRGENRPTEFELLTAMAFDYFHREKVDLAVLEVGMGGTYDSTNIITPLVAVITGVDFDHTAFLGSSLAAIAANKAGIIKPGIPVVVGRIQAEAMTVIKSRAAELGSPVIPAQTQQVSRAEQSLEGGQVINIRTYRHTMERIKFNLLGDYQLQNLSVAMEAVEVLTGLGYKVDQPAIRSALADITIPGRLEIHSRSPLVIADAAHNPEGARALAGSIDNLVPEWNKILVLGLVDDKDQDPVIKWLGHYTRLAIITRPVGSRGNTWRRVAERWKDICPDIPVVEIEDIVAAVQEGMKRLSSQEYLVITGSFYVLDQARRVFTNN